MLHTLNKDGYNSLDSQFDTGKSTIRDESKPMIEQIVKLMKDNGDLRLSIEGHTDNVGDARSNKTLSKQRAKSVMEALVKNDIEGTRCLRWGTGRTDRSQTVGRKKDVRQTVEQNLRRGSSAPPIGSERW